MSMLTDRWDVDARRGEAVEEWSPLVREKRERFLRFDRLAGEEEEESMAMFLMSSDRRLEGRRDEV